MSSLHNMFYVYPRASLEAILDGNISVQAVSYEQALETICAQTGREQRGLFASLLNSTAKNQRGRVFIAGRGGGLIAERASRACRATRQCAVRASA